MADRRIPLVLLPLFLGVITLLLTGTHPEGSASRMMLSTVAEWSLALAFGQMLLWGVLFSGRRFLGR